ncbi:glycosyltransferase [Ferruginibacter sp.]|uniref:glycosyltransferase n=1 Tax=Ferruginibacter sp. TaxID=1940288 RepID=UPI00265800DB|nr:glycosyltransferase [Ferruginibacter sp.]
MRILWFTNTPSNASITFGYEVPGGGWISALELLIAKEQTHQLGVCFFYGGREYKKLVQEGVTYYAIPLKIQNGIQRILSRQLSKLVDEESQYLDQVIQDFQPQIIHVFGTESGYGKILSNKFDKVVFHMQGLLKPYTEVYFPIGFTKRSILKYSSISTLIKGFSFFHGYSDLKNRAEREIETVKHWKYFSGRTHWDRNYIKLLNPEATYFHCDELLRGEFFNRQWSVPKNLNLKQSVVIGTTINPSIYKGLDLIYKVIPLLSDYTIYWKVFGIEEGNELNKVVKGRVNGGLKNSSILFCGPLGATELIDALNTCHFFVHPSYIDNSPNSVCEAQLLGMPVLSSSVGGISTLITNNVNGFVFNPYDRYDLAGLICNLINNYPIAIDAGRKARETALKRHSPAEILKTVNHIYNTIFNA